jgi:hypothetical protein
MKVHRMRVIAGRKYIFYPNLLDRVDGRTRLIPGDIITVVNLPGCPKANTMGHAHVNLNGRFAGLVHVNSLHSLADAALVADRIRQDMERMAS